MTAPAAVPPPPAPEVGDRVGNKYRLVRTIGLGGMGLVFEAEHVRLQQKVAIKFMLPQFVGQTEAVSRFEREGRAASRLTSPHTARIFDVDATSTGIPYIVSEFLEGHDLRRELQDRPRIPVAEAVTCVVQACAAMAEAHSLGIVHRDLKPSNLFLARTPSGRMVKVIDFGVSKMTEEMDLTSTGLILGSPRYMAPEQLQAKRVDGRADVWSLGVILYRCISGVFPFEGDTALNLALAIVSLEPKRLRELVPETPEGLDAAVRQAITADLHGRMASARDFAEAIAPYGTPEAANLVQGMTWASAVEAPSKAPAGDVAVEPADPTRKIWTQAADAKESTPRRGRARIVVAGAAACVLVAAAFVVIARHGGEHAGPAAASAGAAPASAPTASTQQVVASAPSVRGPDPSPSDLSPIASVAPAPPRSRGGAAASSATQRPSAQPPARPAPAGPKPSNPMFL